MSSRRSLQLPIILAILMIILLVALTVGWILLAVFGLLSNPQFPGLYVTFLSVGTRRMVVGMRRPPISLTSSKYMTRARRPLRS